MATDKVSGISFDSERLARVGQRIKRKSAPADATAPR
jgi:hypothetical protein